MKQEEDSAMKIKISNEVKVGVTAILTILAFIYLYNYLKGKDLFSSMASYYTIYDDIGGLTESNPIEINGFKAGVVQSINLINDNTGRILVELSIRKSYPIPKGSVAEITSASLIAGMKVRILFGPGPEVYKNGDTITGRLSVPLMAIFEKEFIPVKNKISDLVDVIDSTISGLNSIINSRDFRESISNLNSTTDNIEEIVGTKKEEIKSAIKDLSAFTGMLAANSGKIDKTINNINTITDSLSASGIFETFTALKSTLEETRELLDGINKGKGSAGQFINNDILYQNLTASLESLDILLRDLKENPKKYVHFSIFGRK